MVSAITDRLKGFNINAGMKAPCYVATTGANLTLSGNQTIDGLAVGSSIRVLVKDQTDATENGIYVGDSSTWVRASDVDGPKDIRPGSLVYVDRGTANAMTMWAFNSSSTLTSLTPGTDELSLHKVTFT